MNKLPSDFGCFIHLDVGSGRTYIGSVNPKFLWNRYARFTGSVSDLSHNRDWTVK